MVTIEGYLKNPYWKKVYEEFYEIPLEYTTIDKEKIGGF